MIDYGYRQVLIGMRNAGLSPAERFEIIVRQECLCFYCGKSLPKGVVFDHLVPRRLRGGHRHDNRVAACAGCDGRKGGRLPTLAERAKQVTILNRRSRQVLEVYRAE